MRNRKVILTAIITTALGVLVLGTYGILTAEEYDPTAFEVILHRTDLYTGSGDTTPENVFNSGAVGTTIDLINNPGDVFGEGDVAVGTYKRMRLTLGNRVSVAGTDPCDGISAYAGTFLINDSLPADAQTQVYFATADDGGESIVTGDGSSAHPFLMQSPIIVEESETTVVRLAFYTSGSLVCSGGVDVNLRPPSVAVASYIEGTEPVVNPEGDYWLAHFNVNTHLYDESTGEWFDPSTSANPDEVLSRIGASTGWGSIHLFAPDSISGIGSWEIGIGSWRDGGFGEHRHNFSAWESSGDGYAGTVPHLPMQGTYQVTGNRIFVSLGSSPSMEGYVADDGSSFILVNIGGVDDSDVVFAVRKPAAAFTGLSNGPFVIVSPQISLHYESTVPSTGNKATGAEFSGQVIVLRGPGAQDDVFSWGTRLELEFESTSGIINIVNGLAPVEDADMSSNLSSYLSFGSDGLATTTPDDNTLFIAVGGDSASGQLGLFAGMAAEYDPDGGEHRLNNGFIVEADPSPSLDKLEGRWALMGVNWEGNEGDDHVWYTGDEEYELFVSYGTLDIDGSGNATYSVLDKDIISQAVNFGTASASMHVVTEYYEVDNPLGNNSGTAIPLTLYTFNEPSGSSTVVARVVLDRRGNTFVFWSPMDAGNIPQADSTADAVGEFSMGVGVKIE